jgi:hypothetical protein
VTGVVVARYRIVRNETSRATGLLLGAGPREPPASKEDRMNNLLRNYT